MAESTRKETWKIVKFEEGWSIFCRYSKKKTKMVTVSCPSTGRKPGRGDEPKMWLNHYEAKNLFQKRLQLEKGLDTLQADSFAKMAFLPFHSWVHVRNGIPGTETSTISPFFVWAMWRESNASSYLWRKIGGRDGSGCAGNVP